MADVFCDFSKLDSVGFGPILAQKVGEEALAGEAVGTKRGQGQAVDAVCDAEIVAAGCDEDGALAGGREQRLYTGAVYGVVQDYQGAFVGQ
jgi:hypothetical protein